MRRFAVLILGLAAVLIGLSFVVTEYWLTLLTFVGLFATVGVGLVLLTGFTGQVSFGHAAFYGLGAYGAALLAGSAGVAPWLAIPLSAGITAAIAFGVGIPVLRLSGHYLALATIAFAIIVEQLFREGNNLGFGPLTGGADGYSSIPPLTVLGSALSNQQFFWLIWAVTLTSLVLAGNLVQSRTGRALRGIRSSEAASKALGVPVERLKLQVFVLSAVFASVAGSLFAFWIAYISPGSFGLEQGIKFTTIAVLGGTGNVWGALLGAGILQALDAGLIELQKALSSTFPSVFGQSFRLEVITYGLLLAVLMVVAPSGLWPLLERAFSRFRARSVLPFGAGLHEREAPRPLLSQRGPDLEPPVLELRGVTKRFGGLVAVSDISFSLARGEILGLIGPNGAGKSTTFNCIAGVYPLSGGEIFFEGQRLDGRSSEAIARIGLFRTFQNTALFESMTVLENAQAGTYTRTHAGFLAGMLHTERSEELRSSVEALRSLEAVGLSADAFSSAATLPVGKRRLLEVARALSGKPTLLLLDEPAAGLRYAEKGELIALLSSLRDQGLTILLVEHDMDLVMRLADRIVVMSYGVKIAEGTPLEIQKNPAVIEAYLGSEAAD